RIAAIGGARPVCRCNFTPRRCAVDITGGDGTRVAAGRGGTSDAASDGSSADDDGADHMALKLTQKMKLLPARSVRRWFAAAFVSALLVAFGASSANGQLCQPLTPAAPYPIWGVDSASGHGCGEVGWDARGMIPWQEFAQGEYVGHARIPHVPEYRVREGDVIAVYYPRTREEIS